MRKKRASRVLLAAAVLTAVKEQEEGFVKRPLITEEGLYEHQEAARMNAELLLSARAAARTPVEAGPLNVRSKVQLIVEVEAPAEASKR